MFNNIKALIVQIGACVSGRSVSLLVMCPWFHTFEYFFHRRERALTPQARRLVGRWGGSGNNEGGTN